MPKQASTKSRSVVKPGGKGNPKLLRNKSVEGMPNKPKKPAISAAQRAADVKKRDKMLGIKKKKK